MKDLRLKFIRSPGPQLLHESPILEINSHMYEEM
jgi:hypothetical protein